MENVENNLDVFTRFPKLQRSGSMMKKGKGFQ